MIVFLDASALIYLIEGVQPFAARVRGELTSVLKRHPNLSLAVSRLSWLECRVQPIRDKQLTVLADYDAFFARPDVLWADLSREVVEAATAIRAKHGLRTPDALQAASCMQLAAQRRSSHLFFTGDTGFKKVAGLSTRLVS